jgi:cob(I)alamin adenosyltransferase
VRIYTRRGDDGTTGLLFGGRVRKDSGAIELNGAVDEAQAALGLARAEADGELGDLLLSIERDLYVLMAEVATAPGQRARIVAGKTLVTPEMVLALEGQIDAYAALIQMPNDFVLPGQTRCSAALDLARTVVRRAERLAVSLDMAGSQVVTYLNRLSDLCWMLARFAESDHVLARSEPRRRPAGT